MFKLFSKKVPIAGGSIPQSISFRNFGQINSQQEQNANVGHVAQGQQQSPQKQGTSLEAAEVIEDVPPIRSGNFWAYQCVVSSLSNAFCGTCLVASILITDLFITLMAGGSWIIELERVDFFAVVNGTVDLSEHQIRVMDLALYPFLIFLILAVIIFVVVFAGGDEWTDYDKEKEQEPGYIELSGWMCMLGSMILAGVLFAEQALPSLLEVIGAYDWFYVPGNESATFISYAYMAILAGPMMFFVFCTFPLFLCFLCGCDSDEIDPTQPQGAENTV